MLKMELLRRLIYPLHDWFCIRPSGTEPKVKIYIGATDSDPEVTRGRLIAMTQWLSYQLDFV
jgi:phosphoglucomutase